MAFCLLLSFTLHNVLMRLAAERVMSNRLSRGIYLSAGLIGTPLHEISHLLVAICSGHRITGIKLFSWNSGAYVMHEYNPRSTFHQLGSFFIAIAPLVFSVLSVHLLLLSEFTVRISLVRDPVDTFIDVLTDIPYLVLNIVLVSDPLNLLLVTLICFYCVPSNSDFTNAAKGSLYGAFLLVIVLIVVIAITEGDGLAQFVGTIVVSSVITSAISVVGWSILLICSGIGNLSTNSVHNT